MMLPRRSRSAHRAELLRNSRTLYGVAALLLALAVFIPQSQGQNTAPSPVLNGNWRLSQSVVQAQNTIQQAVEPAVASLTPDIQRLARARIAETTWVPQMIQIQAAPSRIQVVFQGAETRTFDTAPGQPSNVYSRSGVRAQMTQNYRPDGGIEQQFRAMDGTQWNILVPDHSGRQLSLDVLMQSGRLRGDIRFRLTFAR